MTETAQQTLNRDDLNRDDSDDDQNLIDALLQFTYWENDVLICAA